MGKKIGRKDKTTKFGESCEFYVASLFLMLKNKHGKRRPDLLSLPGVYSPQLSLEVKSGAKEKGVMYASQLHYPWNLETDYKELLDDGQLESLLKEVDGFFKETPEEVTPSHSDSQAATAYYYNQIDRPDGLTSADIAKPFSTIKIIPGNQYLVPHEFGFHTFVIARYMRVNRIGTKSEKEVETLDQIEDMLHAIIEEDLKHSRTHYKTRPKDKNNWQNLHGRDVRAIFFEDMELATQAGRTRIELLSQRYSSFESLKRIEIPGPNKTHIYILAEPQHEDLFDVQVRGVVESRIKTVEKIARERKSAIKLLTKVLNPDKPNVVAGVDLFGNELESPYTDGLNPEEKALLYRLMKWVGRKEIPFHLYRSDYLSPQELEMEKYEKELEGEIPETSGTDKVPF